MKENVVKYVIINREKIPQLAVNVATEESLEEYWETWRNKANRHLRQIHDIEALRELLSEILLKNKSLISVTLKDSENGSVDLESLDEKNLDLSLELNKLSLNELKQIKFFINEFARKTAYDLDYIKAKELSENNLRMYVLFLFEEHGSNFVEIRTATEVYSSFGILDGTSKEVTFYFGLYTYHIFSEFMNIKEIFEIKTKENKSKEKE